MTVTGVRVKIYTHSFQDVTPRSCLQTLELATTTIGVYIVELFNLP